MILVQRVWLPTGVIQTDEYICAGKRKERWTPRFTYHGFRYIELSGMKDNPELSWLKVVTVYTDVEKCGSFECSDSTINRLHKMAIRTMLSNIHVCRQTALIVNVVVG